MDGLSWWTPHPANDRNCLPYLTVRSLAGSHALQEMLSCCVSFSSMRVCCIVVGRLLRVVRRWYTREPATRGLHKHRHTEWRPRVRDEWIVELWITSLAYGDGFGTVGDDLTFVTSSGTRQRRPQKEILPLSTPNACYFLMFVPSRRCVCRDMRGLRIRAFSVLHM